MTAGERLMRRDKQRIGLLALSLAFALPAFALPAFAAAAAAKADAPKQGAANDASAQVDAIADDYLAAVLEFDPGPAYQTGLPLKRHDYLPHNSAADLRAFERREDGLWQRFSAIDRAAVGDDGAQLLYAQLREMLQASRGMRVCKAEGWNVNHMGGWQNNLADLADRQPVTTAEQRKQALTRWRGFPGYVDNEIANLRAGLKAGYSAPKTLGARVLKQIDALLAMKPTQSPFYAPAQHSGDAAFGKEFEGLVADQIQPALRRYRDFLADEYIKQSRDSIGLSALPDGVACYRALLRQFTTLDRAPEEVYALGKRTVAENTRTVSELGQKLFGVSDLPTIVKRMDEAADNRFASADEELAFSRGLLARSRERSAKYFVAMPSQPAIVEPLKEEQRGSGVSSHYEMQPDETKPGIYRANLDRPGDDRRGAAEITLVHETWPGHHLQIALARGVQRHPFSSLAFNSAYVEGWARYAEALSEEAGIYTTPYAAIGRRAWPARGMVLDPGIHLYGWTRQQVVDYMVESGRFSAKVAEESVDRYAAMPGQITSYDSGALEIFALRREAEQALGERFDIRQFHQQVLGDGIVPLQYLRERVQAWIARSREAK